MKTNLAQETHLEKNKQEQVRYNLILPAELYKDILRSAESRGMKVVDMMRLLMKISVWVLHELDTPGTKFVLKNGDSEREIVFFG